jgi:hypothetical protein
MAVFHLSRLRFLLTKVPAYHRGMHQLPAPRQNTDRQTPWRSSFSQAPRYHRGMHQLPAPRQNTDRQTPWRSSFSRSRLTIEVYINTRRPEPKIAKDGGVNLTGLYMSMGELYE